MESRAGQVMSIPATATHFRVYRWDFGDIADSVEAVECILTCADGFIANTIPVSRLDYLTHEAILQVWGPGQYRVKWMRFDEGSMEVVHDEASFLSVHPCNLN